MHGREDWESGKQNTHHFDDMQTGGALPKLGCAECEEPSAQRQDDTWRKALSVILSLQMETPQQVCEGNTNGPQPSTIQKLFNITKLDLQECFKWDQMHRESVARFPFVGKLTLARGPLV